MPLFGFSDVLVGKYNKGQSGVTYDTPIAAGCPIMAQLELTFAEGTLFCRNSLSEYLRMATGGNATLEVKYLPQNAQVAMYGAQTKTRNVEYTPAGGGAKQTKQVVSVIAVADEQGNYVGLAGYGPDQIDGEAKFTAFFVPKVRFSRPTFRIETTRDNITFQTATTTGRFLPDDTSGRVIQEVSVCDSAEEAAAWCLAVFQTGA